MPLLLPRITPLLNQAFDLNRDSPLAAGLVCAVLDPLRMGLDLAQGYPPIIAGAPKIRGFPTIGRANGFGSTFGGGTTDRIDVGPGTTGGARSFAVWAFIASTGGGTAGRIFSRTGDSDRWSTAPTAQWQYVRAYTGGSQSTSWGTSGGTGLYHLVLVDSGVPSAHPLLYQNGVLLSDSAFSGTTGTLNQTGAYCLGNRSSDGARNWDGLLAGFCVWDRALSPQDAFRLYAPQTRWELYRPAKWRKIANAPFTPATTVFRRTLSGLGTRAGSRQIHGGR